MTSRLVLFTVLSSAALWSGCASTASGPEEFPRYSGSVIPIEVPFEPRYAPHSSTLAIVMEFDIRHGGEGGKAKAELKMNQTVRQAGEGFEWLGEVTEMDMLGQRIRTKVPVMTARWFTDKFGEVTDFEVAYPGFAELGIKDTPPTPSRGSKEYDDLLRQFGGGSRIPAEPVVSGDRWVNSTLRELFGDLPGLNQAFLDQQVSSRVLGFSYYNDRRVIVVHQTVDVPASSSGDGNLSMTMDGYILIDALTLAKVQGEMKLIMAGVEDGENFLVRINTSAAGTVTD